MAIEFELKFRATPDILDAIQKNTAGEDRLFSMETTYYDTPEGILSSQYHTLRRRQENDTSVCTLKTPAKGRSRNEFEIQCATIEEALPRLQALSGVTLPQAADLIPLCGAKFTRIARTVVLEDCTVELALDQGVLTGGGKEAPLCEVEVELKAGTENSARAYAAQLALAFGLVPEKKSKFRRAKDLAGK